MPFITQVQGSSSGNANIRSTGVIVLKYASSLATSPDNTFTITINTGTPLNAVFKIKSSKLANVKEQLGCDFVLDLSSITGSVDTSTFVEKTTPKYINFDNGNNFPSASNVPLRGQYYHTTDGNVDYAVLGNKARYIIAYDGSSYIVMNEALVSYDGTGDGNVYSPTIQYMETYVTNMLSTRWQYVVCPNNAAQIPAGATYWDGVAGHSTITGSMAASSSTEYKIYLVLHNTHDSDKDIYDEWITVKTLSGNQTQFNWEKLGNTDVNIDYNLYTDTVTPASYEFSSTVHSHTVSEGGHSHTMQTTGNHSHTVNVPNHSHTISSSGGHTHTFEIGLTSGVVGISGLSSSNKNTTGNTDHTHVFTSNAHSHTVSGGSHSHAIQEIGNHSHTVDISSHTHSISNSGGHTHTFEIDKASLELSFYDTSTEVHHTSYSIPTVTITTGASTGTNTHSHNFNAVVHSHVVDGGKHTHSMQLNGNHTHSFTMSDHSHVISTSGAHTHTTDVFNNFVVDNEILYLSHSHNISESGEHSHVTNVVKGVSMYTSANGNHSHTTGLGEHTHTVSTHQVEATVDGGSHSHTYNKASVTTHTLTLTLVNNYTGTILSSGSHSHETGGTTSSSIKTGLSGAHSHTMSTVAHNHTVGTHEVTGTVSGGSHQHTYTQPTITTSSLALTTSGTTFTIESSGEHTHNTSVHTFAAFKTTGSGSHSHTTSGGSHTHAVQTVQVSGTVSGGAHSHTVIHNS